MKHSRRRIDSFSTCSLLQRLILLSWVGCLDPAYSFHLSPIIILKGSERRRRSTWCSESTPASQYRDAMFQCSTSNLTATSKTASCSSQNQTPRPHRPPLYITIGPPCAGKTTALENLYQNSTKQQQTGGNDGPPRHHVIDITLDNQQDVYVRVPTRLFLVNQANRPSDASSEIDTRLLQRRVQYKTLESRIYGEDCGELRAVLQRLGGVLTANQFQDCITRVYQNYTKELCKKAKTGQQKGRENKTRVSSVNVATTGRGDDGINTPRTGTATQGGVSSQVGDDSNNNVLLEDDIYTQARKDLVSVVEELIANAAAHSSGLRLPGTTDLFCVESLFRPHMRTNQTGMDAAYQQLLNCATRTHQRLPVAWGNTNTRPREYKTALEVAERSGRPVHFVVYMDLGIIEEQGSGMPVGCLPVLPPQELLRRNINRLMATGKYVPAKSIMDSSQRIQNLVSLAIQRLEREAVASGSGSGRKLDPPPVQTFSKFEFDKTLAKLVNFDMLPDRTVRNAPPPAHKKQLRPRQNHRSGHRPQNRPSRRARRKQMGSQNESPA